MNGIANQQIVAFAVWASILLIPQRGFTLIYICDTPKKFLFSIYFLIIFKNGWDYQRMREWVNRFCFVFSARTAIEWSKRFSFLFEVKTKHLENERHPSGLFVTVNGLHNLWCTILDNQMVGRLSWKAQEWSKATCRMHCKYFKNKSIDQNSLNDVIIFHSKLHRCIWTQCSRRIRISLQIFNKSFVLKIR